MTIPFGETLRRLRIEKGLSQQQLADRLHMERSSVSNWEAGRRIPDAAAISQLAKALGVEAAVLFAANEESDEAPNVLLVDDEAIILAGGLPLLRQAHKRANIRAASAFQHPLQIRGPSIIKGATCLFGAVCFQRSRMVQHQKSIKTAGKLFRHGAFCSVNDCT